MASVTVTLPESEGSLTNTFLRMRQANTGTPNPSLGAGLSAIDGQIMYLQSMTIRRSDARINLQLVDDPDNDHTFGSGPDFSEQMEMNGTITFAASDGGVVVVDGISDATEPYLWIPSNSTAFASFRDHVIGLFDRTVIITFDDNATQLFERVSGVYVPVEVYERVSGAYVAVEPFIRQGGVYVQ